MECGCGFVAKSGAGLASHRRSKHDDQAVVEVVGSNRAAVEVTLEQLRLGGRLEQIDEARVHALRSIASALDTNPFNAQMWREYRESLEALTADDSDDGALADLLAELSSPVRDPKAT